MRATVIDRRYKWISMVTAFKPRLGRLGWLYTNYPTYFLTACAFDRRRILANQAVRESFVSFAERATDRQVYVGRYVLMRDHVHFFAGFSPGSPGVGDWMKSFKNAISKALRRIDIPSPHWQKGYFDHVLRSAESYGKKWEYVRDNSVRAGLVKTWEEWPYQGEIHPLAINSL